MQAEMLEAVKQGNLEQVKKLVQQDQDLRNAVDEQGTPAVLIALYYNEPAIADYLVSQGAEIGLFAAAALGDLERVQSILKAQPERMNEFSTDGFQALGLAAFFSREPVIRWLLEQGADVSSPSRNNRRVTPLHSALVRCSSEIVQLLLDHGADPNAQQQGGFTPLHEAAQKGDVDMVMLLLKFGANPSLRLENGQTPAELARHSGHEEAAAAIESAMQDR